jgi:hypothetical protein
MLYTYISSSIIPETGDLNAWAKQGIESWALENFDSQTYALKRGSHMYMTFSTIPERECNGLILSNVKTLKN